MGISTFQVFFMGMCLAVFCMVIPAFSDTGEYPPLERTLWKQTWGESDGFGYTKFLDMPVLPPCSPTDEEGRPIRHAYRYFLAKDASTENKKKYKNRTDHRDYAGWRQEGSKVFIYNGDKIIEECEFVDATTIRGMTVARVDGKNVKVRLTLVTDPDVAELLAEVDAGPKTVSGTRQSKKTPYAIRIVNPRDASVTVNICGSGDTRGGVDFEVKPRGAAARFFPNGSYEIFFTFSDDLARYQGDNVVLSNKSVELKLQEAKYGNYGLRRID